MKIKAFDCDGNHIEDPTFTGQLTYNSGTEYLLDHYTIVRNDQSYKENTISIYNDAKEKWNSFEARCLIRLEKNNSVFNVELETFGGNEEEVLKNLRDDYTDLINRFLMVIQKGKC